MNQVINSNIKDGTVISVPKGLIEHYGIYTTHPYWGFSTVISNSGKHGKVVEESLQEFSGNKTIKINGYPGNLPPNKVVQNARSLLNRPYNVFTSNCEHFVRKVHGEDESSPQLYLYTFIALMFWLVVQKD